jgi:hypothetical protein
LQQSEDGQKFSVFCKRGLQPMVIVLGKNRNATMALEGRR